MPTPSFVAAGPLAANNAIATLAVVAPTLAADDIMIAALMNKHITQTISPPDGTWTQLVQDSNDCTASADDHRFAVYWKRAASGDSGASFTFTKSSDDNLLFVGVISAWRDCAVSGSPLDATAVGAQKTAGAADAVTFPAFDPTTANTHVVFLAFYGNDQTTFSAAMSPNTDPACTLRFALESSTGTDASIAATSGDATGAAIASRTWPSGSFTDSGNTGIVFALIPVPVSGVTLTATPGSYTLTGTAAGLLQGRLLTATAGTYAIAGTPAGLLHGYHLAATPGAYALSGALAGLALGRRLTATAGAYALTGTAAGLRLGRRLTATPGAYAVTGTAAGLLQGRRLTATAGAYAVTGTAATLTHTTVGAFALEALPGTYTVSGTATGLRIARVLGATPGAYALTGSSAALLVTRRLTATSGSYAVTGSSASLRRSYPLTATAGSYALTGTAATLTYTPAGAFVLTATAGSYALTGTAADLRLAHRLTATAGAYALSGTPASLARGRTLQVTAGAYAILGTPATLRHAVRLVATAGSYLIVGTPAALLYVPGAQDFDAAAWAELRMLVPGIAVGAGQIAEFRAPSMRQPGIVPGEILTSGFRAPRLRQPSFGTLTLLEED